MRLVAPAASYGSQFWRRAARTTISTKCEKTKSGSGEQASARSARDPSIGLRRKCRPSSSVTNSMKYSVVGAPYELTEGWIDARRNRNNWDDVTDGCLTNGCRPTSTPATYAGCTYCAVESATKQPPRHIRRSEVKRILHKQWN